MPMLPVLAPFQLIPSCSAGRIMVRDLDLVSPTVMRPRQSSVSSVGVPSGKNRPLRKPVLGCATIATAAVPPAELAMVSTRSVLGKFFLMVERLRLFLWSVAVVITKRPSENPVLVEKLSSTWDTNVSMSAATSPLILALVSQSTNW